MSVIRKSDRGWQVLIRKKNYAPVYKTFISKAVATNWAQETELKIEQGIFQNLEEAGRTTLKEILLSYRDNVTTKKRGHVQEATKINKLMRQDITKNNLARLSTLKISKFRDAWLLNHNPSTVNKYLTIISCSIDYAMQELGIYLPGNACKNVERPREPKFSSDVIETFEEDLLLKFSADSKAVWLKAMIILGIDCGMRRGEILKLTSKDVSYETGTAVLRLTKNGEDRKIGLTPRAMEELKKLPVNIDGRLINCKNVDQFKFYWRPIGLWLKHMTHGLNYTLVVVDHSGKSVEMEMRETSSKADWANVCLQVLPEKREGGSMKIKVKYAKARGLRPDQTDPFVCQYDLAGNWTLGASDKEQADEELKEEFKEAYTKESNAKSYG